VEAYHDGDELNPYPNHSEEYKYWDFGREAAEENAT